jgi:hypothetical protein
MEYLETTDALEVYAAAWDAVALAARQQAMEPRTAPHVTAQMVYDIWRDGCSGPGRVAAIIRDLSPEDRAAVEVSYWNLLRSLGHVMSLVEIRLTFELATLFC